MQTTEEQIRKMARSNTWQSLYRASKESSSVCLFENKTNLSSFQISFIYWLQVYDTLYTELSQHDSEYLSKDVILNDTRCDAYLYFRNKRNDHFWKKHKQQERINEMKSRHPKKHSGKTNVVDVDLRST